MKTSQHTMEVFKSIDAREHLKPFALAKISIALALRAHYKYDGKNTDSLGLELDHDTITGKNRLLFKKLIEMSEGNSIAEDEYYPAYLKSYLDYGANLLEKEYKYSSDFYLHLMELDKGI